MSYADRISTSHMLDWGLGPSVNHESRIVARQWLKDPEISVRFQSGTKYLYLFQGVQTGSEPHLASSSLIIGYSFPCDKACHSSSCNLEVKNEWSYASTPPCAFKICTRTVLPLRMQVSWDVTLRFSACSCRRFEGTTIFPDVRDYTPDDMKLLPRKLEFSATRLSENKISQPIISLYNINRSVFMMESNCVFCEVGCDFFFCE